MTVHAFNDPEEYARVLAAARGARVAVQELGDYTLVVPDQWKPPRPPRAKPEPVVSSQGNGETTLNTETIVTNAPSPTRTAEETGGGGER